MALNRDNIRFFRGCHILIKWCQLVRAKGSATSYIVRIFDNLVRGKVPELLAIKQLGMHVILFINEIIILLVL